MTKHHVKPMKESVTVRLTPELYEALKRESFGDTLAEVARRRLEASFADSPEPLEIRSAGAVLKDQKLAAEVAEKERKNAIAAGEVIAIADVLKVVEDKISPVRQAIQQAVNAIDGATDEQRAQLEKWAQDTLTNLSGFVFK